MPAGGGTSQTAVNRIAGARTQVAELVTAAAALATLLLLAPVIALMPQAALAAVVVVLLRGADQAAEFREIAPRAPDRVPLGADCVRRRRVLLGTLQGILVAVIASLLALAHQAYNPPVYVLGRKRGTDVFRPLSSEHPDDETWPGLLILRTEGRVFFANAQRIGDQIWVLIEQAQPAVVRARLQRGVRHRIHGAEDADRGGRAVAARRASTLWLAALNPEVLAVVKRSRLGADPGPRAHVLQPAGGGGDSYEQA